VLVEEAKVRGQRAQQREQDAERKGHGVWVAVGADPTVLLTIGPASTSLEVMEEVYEGRSRRSTQVKVL
jgi:hypothetical protein